MSCPYCTPSSSRPCRSAPTSCFRVFLNIASKKNYQCLKIHIFSVSKKLKNLISYLARFKNLSSSLLRTGQAPPVALAHGPQCIQRWSTCVIFKKNKQREAEAEKWKLLTAASRPCPPPPQPSMQPRQPWCGWMPTPAGDRCCSWYRFTQKSLPNRKSTKELGKMNIEQLPGNEPLPLPLPGIPPLSWCPKQCRRDFQTCWLQSSCKRQTMKPRLFYRR